MDKLLNKGDVVKTSLNDSTLVLKVDGNDALLFSGSQFIVAHGVQKENDKVFWNQGDYYDELPDNIFEKDMKIHHVIKEKISEQGENINIDIQCTHEDSEYEESELEDEEDWELEA